ncbi:MAG: class-II fumarase/aspartase family protein, partial [Gammaproteobacteria bacterium]
RNPEIAEHLGTLARQVRYQAAQMNENLVHDHERDGRSWKSEWVIVPGACLGADKALALLQVLLEQLQVNEARMLANLTATKGFIHAEQAMLALASTLGKQAAHEVVYRVAMAATEQGLTFKEALLAEPEVVQVLDAKAIENLFELKRSIGCCGQMVDRVLADVRAWPDGEHGG